MTSLSATARVSVDSQSIAPSRTSRISSIDILRGMVMVIMALDHTRDYFSNATFDPTDLTRTNALLFFTRWITHFCAPIFVFLTGTGAFLSAAKRDGSGSRSISPFLFTRGLWLIFLEIMFISPLGWSFRFDWSFTRLQVIWVIGLSMIILAASIRIFPPKLLAAFGAGMILAHNLFDGPRSAWLGPAEHAWKVLHAVGFFQVFPHKVFASLYPLVPWVGVMAVGWGFGGVFLLPPERQRKLLMWTGLGLVGLFTVLRISNFYGDPKPWTPQATVTMTVLSVLNTTKYPPSLLYLLMTLGPAALFLAWASKLHASLSTPLIRFGKVPLFYYLLHIPLIHGLAVAVSYLRYGDAIWLFQDPFVARNSRHPFPAGYGYDLWVVYAVWIAVVLMLYPVCTWYGDFKTRVRHPLLSYL